MHKIFVASDCSENIIRILLVDFHKAFDLIDHNILFNKLLSSGVPEHVIAWSLDFLNDHKQFVKIGDSVSATTTVTAGTPQGTVPGLNDFKVIINHLTFNTTYAKYVDDTTVLSVSRDVNDSTLQSSADYLVQWTQHNTMAINTKKTKELIICFSKKVNITDIPRLCINGTEIDKVTTFKLLGVIYLSWDSHVTYTVF